MSKKANPPAPAALSLRDRAAAAVAAADQTAHAKRLQKFAALLKDLLGIDAQPTSLDYEHDGIWFYLEGERLRVYHVCPKCQTDLPGNFVASLADLGAELQRPLLGHNCKKPEPAAPVAALVPSADSEPAQTALDTSAATPAAPKE